MKEIYKRMEKVCKKISFNEFRQDLSALYNVEIVYRGKNFTLRSPFLGKAGRIFQVLRIR